MKHVILGTAGHIDHGKTALIKALTGIDTDRLKEEKLRGITIELGFASLLLPSGQMVGVIDVPGHERFVKNMVAGAATVDIVALVIAADEGVMPQTREHLEICRLLQVKKGLVVLTKMDLVDEEWLDLVREDIHEFIQGTFLEEALVIPVSSMTLEGFDTLLAELDRICATVEEKARVGVFRLPVDRVFTMKGFGTVVTGTSISGSIRVGDPVSVYPGAVTAKIRGLQVHGREVEEASAGLRTAVNLQGLDKETIERGDVLATADSLRTSRRLDVHLQLLSSVSKPLKNRTRVRFHTGTAELFAEVILLENDELRPGETAFAQLIVDPPTAVLPHDRYVIRSYSPVHTIGGGEILAAAPPRHKRRRPDVLHRLEIFRTGAPADVIAALVEQAGESGLSRVELAKMVAFPKKTLDSELQKMQTDRLILQYAKEPPVYMHSRVFEALKQAVAEALDQYHRKYPLRPGMNKEALKSQTAKQVDSRLFNFLIGALQADGILRIEQDVVHLSGHQVLLKEEEEQFREKLEKTYLKAGLAPPYFKELQDSVPPSVMREVLSHLVAAKILVKVKEDLYFHGGPLEELRAKLVSYLKERGEITTQEFKELTGVSRKYTIPLFEYFDGQQVTMRVGEKRVLRSQK